MSHRAGCVGPFGIRLLLRSATPDVRGTRVKKLGRCHRRADRRKERQATGTTGNSNPVASIFGGFVAHRGNVAPGSFVWFSEGERMEYGASAEGGASVVFITNKAFRIARVEL